MSTGERILLVGFGNMGQALVRGWLARGRDPATIAIADPTAEARSLATGLGVAAFADLAAARERTPSVVVLAVKPNHLTGVLENCAGLGSAETVFLSIVAGKTLARIAAGLGPKAAIVRAMPNTPAAIGKGMSVLVANGAASAAQRELCAELLAGVGSIAWIADERHMDAVTAVSGSGPAYVFLLIECIEKAALDAGLEPALAAQLALATVTGAAAYADAAGIDAAELRRRVTSPNGTTQAALEVLMSEGGLADLLVRAIRAAAARSRELAGS